MPNSESLGKKYLKKDAIPSVFNFPKHLQKRSPKKRAPVKRSNPGPPETPPAVDPKHVRIDHTYASNISPRKMKANYKKKLRQKNKIINRLRARNFRKEKTIKGLMLQLNKLKLLSEENEKSIIDNFGHMATELFRNEAKNCNKLSGSRYPQEIKEFAISLHFYSPRAYKFVRKSLNLPHPATIRSWSVNIECEPGFLKKPFEFVEGKVNEGQKDCVLMLDEMSIKKQLQWDKKQSKFVGNTDYGTFKADANDTIATNALLFMVCGLQKPWYVPIAYFLTNNLNGDILKQLIYEAINLLTEKGAEVSAVIFDGASKNISMAEKLGCNIKRLETSFPHPSKPNQKVYVILDICHMLKLARNAFADIKVFCTPSGEKISWEYVLALHRTQQKDVLNLANKLKSKHVQWQNHKMKVSVAAQTLSHSVSAAITFLRNLQVPEFKDSKATSEFILLMNNLFDILNSKSKFGKYTKRPITLENFYEIEGYLMDGIETLKFLKDTAGTPIIKGPRKTFILGFTISALSIINISKMLLERTEAPFEYILTYRFSQDQIEMYFSKIRSRFGWNNNPTVLQFKYALRQLLSKNKIESPSTANCVDVANVNNSSEVNKVDSRISEMLLSNNVWRHDALHYISGYIVKKILESLECPDCALSLYQTSDSSADHGYKSHLSLLSCKRYGNLLVPSWSVYKVVECVDKVARTGLCKWQCTSKEVNANITTTVLHEMKNVTFLSIQEHSQQCHVLDEHLRDDHITTLIKLIVKNYLVIFYHQFGRIYTERIIKGNKSSRRHKLTKQILFNHE